MGKQWWEWGVGERKRVRCPDGAISNLVITSLLEEKAHLGFQYQDFLKL